jgi:hypothetical protein
MRTRGNNGIIGQAILPGTNGAGIIAATDAAQAWLGGAWPGTTSTNVIYGPGLGNTTISNVVVTDSNYVNTFGTITVSGAYVKIFGTGFVSNTTVLVNANSVPVTGVTFASSEELRVALPTIANNQTIQFNVTNAGAPKFTAVYNQVTVDYLIVAGGGSGGWSGAVAAGGGGAGGLLTGTQTLVPGTTYPVVVGSGGRVIAGMGIGSDKSGNNSTAFGLTAIGGGRGGWGCSCNAGTGGSGGGGGAYTGAGKLGALATGSPGVGVAGTQGYPGGTATPVAGPGLPAPASARGGGGGGAGGSGSTTSGGAGYTWPFTANTYAGGGGGAVGGGGGSPGGSGGGGSGCGSANNMGLTFTGSGGGGQSTGSPRDLSGAPGIVIIAAPGAFYPKISIPAPLLASGNVSITAPPAAPGSTVITFRGSGSFSVTS